MEIPKEGFARLPQIIGQKAVSEEKAKMNAKNGKAPRRARTAITPVIPVSRAGWYRGIAEGRYPKGKKLSARATVWKWEDIQALLDGTFNGNVGAQRS